jgi:hypothetical protein
MRTQLVDHVLGCCFDGPLPIGRSEALGIRSPLVGEDDTA